MNSTLRQFIRFTIGGLGLFLLRISTVYVLTDIVYLFYAYSYAIALIVVIITGYFYNAHIAYKSKNVTKKSFLKYVTSILGFYVVDYFAVLALVEFLSVNYLLAITGVTPTLFLLKYKVYERIFH